MAILYAHPTCAAAVHQRTLVRTYPLQTALNRAEAGDTVELLPGRYTDRVVVSTTGEQGKPITITGPRDLSAILDGRQLPESANDDFDPWDNDFAFFQFQSVSWINVKRLAFRNCWPSAVFLRGCKDMAFSDLDIEGGRFAFYARNAWQRSKAKRITLERIRWIQDPDRDMWEGRVTWEDVKQETPTRVDARYFNGALFGSYDIHGPVTIRECDVSHAFNVVRMDAKNTDTTRQRNVGIRIENCRFSFIRDNAVEPEKVASKLFVLGNRFYNVHAAFSMDGVTGSHWYYVGNRILNLFMPGRESEENRGGKILKLHKKAPYPTAAFYVLFNSIQTRTAYAKDGTTRSLLHANNAIGICVSGPECYEKRVMFDDVKWDESCRFLHDICDFEGYPDTVFDNPVSGADTCIPAGGPTFKPPALIGGPVPSKSGWDGELALAGKAGVKTSEAFDLELPDESTVRVPGGMNVGADSGKAVIELLGSDAIV